MAGNFSIRYTDDSIICENVPESLQTPEFINSQGKYISDTKIEKYKTIGTIAGGLITLGTGLLALCNSVSPIKPIEDIEKMKPRDRVNYLTNLSENQIKELIEKESKTKIVQVFFDALMESEYSIKEKDIIREASKTLIRVLDINFPE